MAKPIIEVENLNKLYHLGLIDATTLRDSVECWWLRLRGKKEMAQQVGAKHLMISPDDPQAGPEPNTIWALKDVSFSVQQGEILGIIGRNGAGKSTLLKILSRITEPTEGKAVIRGRTSSLLEVGTGFHPELTGRDNVYLNGAILGMRRSEIDRKFDEIVSFAEIEKFIDTPVKRYSSGMYVRLAFAVAAHLEPEILLVDEVLAVGDTAFQKKCLGKMGDVAKEGRTVLFVSHNMSAIQRLCSTCILLENGHLLLAGSSSHVIAEYLYTISQIWKGVYYKRLSSSVDNEAYILKACISDASGKSRNSFAKNEPFFINIDYRIIKPLKNVYVSVWFLTMESFTIMATYDTDSSQYLAHHRKPGTYHVRIHVKPNFFNVGQYGIRLLAFVPGTQTKYFDDTSLYVEITGPREEWRHQIGAVVQFFEWEIKYEDESGNSFS